VKIRMQGWPLFVVFFLLTWLIAHPIWKCAQHLETIRARIEMHFGPGPNDLVTEDSNERN